MNKPSRLRRRDLLRIGALGAAGAATAALAGCGETQVVEIVKEVPVEKVKEVVKEVPVEREKIVTKIVERIVTVEVAPKLRAVTLTGWTFAHLPRWHKANGDLFAAQTNVKTEWVGVSEIWDKLSVALQTGVGAPDMVDIEQGAMGRYLKGDIQLVDLKPMLTREGYWDKLVTSRQALYTWEGRDLRRRIRAHTGRDVFQPVPVREIRSRSGSGNGDLGRFRRVGSEVQERVGRRDAYYRHWHGCLPHADGADVPPA